MLTAELVHHIPATANDAMSALRYPPVTLIAVPGVLTLVAVLGDANADASHECFETCWGRRA